MMVIPYSITLGINVAWSSVLDINLELRIDQVLFLSYSFIFVLFYSTVQGFLCDSKEDVNTTLLLLE